MSSQSTLGGGSVNVQGQYNLVPPVYVDGDAATLQTDVNGNLKVTLVDPALSQLNQEVTQLLVLTELQTLNAVDFATETTLAAILADTTAIAAIDFATETTLAAILADTTAIAAVDFATETTLAAILADTTAIAAVDFATETTLAAILADTTAIAATDFATETTLAQLLADFNAEDFATETTLAAMSAKLPATLGQLAMAASLSVAIASDQSPIPIAGDVAHDAVDSGNPVKIGGFASAAAPTAVASGDRVNAWYDLYGRQYVAIDQPITVTVADLTVVDQIDSPPGPVLDAAVDNIQDNAGAFLEVVASLAADVKQVRVADTTGQFIGVYTGAPASEVLAFIINPGQDDACPIVIPSGTRISIRSMGTTVIDVGQLALQFLG